MRAGEKPKMWGPSIIGFGGYHSATRAGMRAIGRYVPVRMLACDGGVSGTCAYARVNTTDCLAKASRFGVSPRCDPRNPIRSARVVSRVIRIMLGSCSATGRLGTSANKLPFKAAINNNEHIPAIVNRNPPFDSALSVYAPHPLFRRHPDRSRSSGGGKDLPSLQLSHYRLALLRMLSEVSAAHSHSGWYS